MAGINSVLNDLTYILKMVRYERCAPAVYKENIAMLLNNFFSGWVLKL